MGRENGWVGWERTGKIMVVLGMAWYGWTIKIQDKSFGKRLYVVCTLFLLLHLEAYPSCLRFLNLNV